MQRKHESMYVMYSCVSQRPAVCSSVCRSVCCFRQFSDVTLFEYRMGSVCVALKHGTVLLSVGHSI